MEVELTDQRCRTAVENSRTNVEGGSVAEWLA